MSNLLKKMGNLLAVGKLKYQKGFDLLLESMARIKRVDCHLTILGQGPEEHGLKKCAHMNWVSLRWLLSKDL